MSITITGINHHNCPVNIRESVSILNKKLSGLYKKFPYQPVVLLSTCNRLEIIFETNKFYIKKEIIQYLSEMFQIEKMLLYKFLHHYIGLDALQYLLRISTGLDSAIIGETEIFGQVKSAYKKSKRFTTYNSRFENYFQWIFHVTKKIRSKTKISEGSQSIPKIAIKLVQKNIPDLRSVKILFIGTGKINRQILRYLYQKKIDTILIANRTYKKAKKLADRFSCRSVKFDLLPELINSADLIFTSTAAPHYILSKTKYNNVLKNRNKPLIIFDMAVPRDVDPALSSKDIQIYNIDDIKDIVNKNILKRKYEISIAEQMIKNEINNWYQKKQISVKTG